MYKGLREAIIAEVRKHKDEGDCRTPHSYSIEALEDVILDLVGWSVAAADRECPVSPLPSGKHQVDTSMESGPNNCFFCEKPMPRFASPPHAKDAADV